MHQHLAAAIVVRAARRRVGLELGELELELEHQERELAAAADAEHDAAADWRAAADGWAEHAADWHADAAAWADAAADWRRDALALRFDRRLPSYWSARERDDDLDRYFRQS